MCLKVDYRKRKGSIKTGYRKRIWGLKCGYGNKRGVSNMVTEEKKGLKYGYRNELGRELEITKSNPQLQCCFSSISSDLIIKLASFPAFHRFTNLPTK